MSGYIASNGIKVTSETQSIIGYRRIKFETDSSLETVEISGPAMVALIETLDSERDNERSVIPEDASYITWVDIGDGEERIAMRYGHHANRVWRMGFDTFDEDDLVRDYIGASIVTVLVRKEDQ